MMALAVSSAANGIARTKVGAPMPTLKDIFPDAKQVLTLTPEDLGGVLIELWQQRKETHQSLAVDDFLYQLFPESGGRYPREILLAMAEAMAWLANLGVIVRDPAQDARRFAVTRRGMRLKTRKDLEEFRKGKALPIELLQPGLAEKVHGLFVRGDYDVAVFQAFKEIEVAVRKAGGYSNEFYGKALMEMAFNPKEGPLRDKSAQSSEQQAEMFLFAGAMGHAKNPIVHREVKLSVESAARLILFASHLLGIVHERFVLSLT